MTVKRSVTALAFGVVVLSGLACAPSGQGNSNPYAGKVIFSGLRTSLMSVSGRSGGEIYAAGADLGDGEGPNFLAFNGQSWRRLSTGAVAGDVWWMSVEPIDGSFYLAGEPGLVLRFDPDAKTFEQQETIGNQTLFGIWGTAASNLWAVGGDLANPDTGGVVWHFDGQAWSDVDLSSLLPDGVPLLYKVWGRSANEVYIVGTRCTGLRFDGTSWSNQSCQSESSLFTVSGNDDLVVGVGGYIDGLIVELSGDAFVDRTPGIMRQMNGVFVPLSGTPIAVGIEGSLATRSNTGWELQNTELDTILDFHGVWIDPDGGIWAVGGNLNSGLNDGMVVYFGPRTISNVVDNN